MKFDTDIEKVWLYKINKEITNIQNEIDYKLHAFSNAPLISISDSKCKWGEWNPTTNTINLSISLLRNYEWGAVKYVLRHEFAHFVVSTIFKFGMAGVAHGEAFKKACDVLGIDADRCASYAYLNGFKTSDGNGMVDRVRKLLTKGNCSSLNKEEADLFLNKAREIMVRHNIDMASVCGNDRFWVVRPVGSLYRKTPCYTNILRDIVEKFYFVKTIRTHAYVNQNGFRRSMRVIEMFGEKHNVELAEYIYHSLLMNAEILWKEFVTEKKKQGSAIRGVYHKNNFIDGLFKGYQSQLEINEVNVTNLTTQALIHIHDPMLEEYYKKQYPNLVYGRSYYSRSCGGGSEGYAVGKEMRISRGVGAGGGNNGKCLNA